MNFNGYTKRKVEKEIILLNNSANAIFTTLLSLKIRDGKAHCFFSTVWKLKQMNLNRLDVCAQVNRNSNCLLTSAVSPQTQYAQWAQRQQSYITKHFISIVQVNSFHTKRCRIGASSDPSGFTWAASVVWHRRVVRDRYHLQASHRQAFDCRLQNRQGHFQSLRKRIKTSLVDLIIPVMKSPAVALHILKAHSVFPLTTLLQRLWFTSALPDSKTFVVFNLLKEEEAAQHIGLL